MGSGSIQLFKVAGIRLEMHFTFVLFGFAFALIGGLTAGVFGVFWFTAFLAAIFACVVLHELGHCLTARFHEIGVSRILLLPIGGMAQFERIPREPGQEIAISIAGPLVNFVLAVLLLVVVDIPSIPAADAFELNTTTFLQGLLAVNVIMGLFNLLPIFPMDGGRILRALLALKFSYLEATAFAAKLAKVLATIGILVAIFRFGAPLPAILFAVIYIGGDMEYRVVKRREKTKGLFVGDLVSRHFLSIEAERPMGEAIEIFLAFRPSEILVTRGGVPLGVLTGKAVGRAQRRGWLARPVKDFTSSRITVLQAGWPLDPFLEMIVHSRQRLYPVYSFGDLVGVLNTRTLDTMIEWKRLEERSRCDIRFREDY